MDASHQAGFGIAAWAVTKMLMGSLRTRGLLSQEDGASIIEHSLHLLEGIDEIAQDEAFHHGRVQMESWMKEWHETAKSELPQAPLGGRP